VEERFASGIIVGGKTASSFLFGEVQEMKKKGWESQKLQWRTVQ
jgi:hypothetical protein